MSTSSSDPGTRSESDPGTEAQSGARRVEPNAGQQTEGRQEDSGDAAAAAPMSSRDHPRDLRARQRAAFGGMKFGSDFFGWLAAIGATVILTAVAAAVGAGFGTSSSGGVQQAVGLAGAIAVAVILFVSYLAGGYVAGRMARFNGLKQGLGVWLWAIIVAIVLAIIGAIAGGWFNVFQFGGLPRISLAGGGTIVAIITGIVLAAIALIGALLGGLGGMGYHRRIDRAGFDYGRDGQ
jgi:hypothetical protein